MAFVQSYMSVVAYKYVDIITVWNLNILFKKNCIIENFSFDILVCAMEYCELLARYVRKVCV